MTFLLDSNDFVNGPAFPARGCMINKTSFSLAFGSATVGLQVAFPAAQTPDLVLRDNDPAADGFLVSTNNESPLGVPISQTGVLGQFIDNR